MLNKKYYLTYTMKKTSCNIQNQKILFFILSINKQNWKEQLMKH